MPASKKTAAAAVRQGPPPQPTALTGRAAKRAAPKAATAPKTAKAQRAAPQAPSTYTASTWGAANNFELTTPSGQTCLCRDLPLEELMEAGLLDTINGLSGIVDLEVLPQAQGQPPAVDMAKVMQNGEALLSVLALVNTIVCMGVVAPEIHPIVDGEGNRVKKESGLVYVDSIPAPDRMFLFNELTGGLEQLAAFR